MNLNSRAARAAALVPWAMPADWLGAVLSIADREPVTLRLGEEDIPAPAAVAARVGTRLDNTRVVQVRDGVAVIPVTGPIFRYANMMTEISGATSLQVLARDFSTALGNPDVTSILLEIDSPGGMASGIGEFADMVYQARGVKPIKAYVSDMGASAAYWIASAAGEIITAESAELGSIGVVMAIRDSREAETRAGLRTIEVVSSQSPNKRLDPITDEGRAAVQTRVDNLASIFVAAVARNRGVTAEAVVADMGAGGIKMGGAAVAARLSDRLGSFEGVVAELAGRRSSFRPARAAAVEQQQEKRKMDAQQIAEEFPQAAEALRAEGAAAERARIVAIDAIDHQAEEAGVIAEAIAEGLSATDAAARVHGAMMTRIRAQEAADAARGPALLDKFRADEAGTEHAPAAASAAGAGAPAQAGNPLIEAREKARKARELVDAEAREGRTISVTEAMRRLSA